MPEHAGGRWDDTDPCPLVSADPGASPSPPFLQVQREKGSRWWWWGYRAVNGGGGDITLHTC